LGHSPGWEVRFRNEESNASLTSRRFYLFKLLQFRIRVAIYAFGLKYSLHLNILSVPFLTNGSVMMMMIIIIITIMCACAANAVGRDFDIFAVGIVSLGHILRACA
jgi:hypothetical protein